MDGREYNGINYEKSVGFVENPMERISITKEHQKLGFTEVSRSVHYMLNLMEEEYGQTVH